jgi:hypothetical protein
MMYYSATCLEGLRKTKMHINQDLDRRPPRNRLSQFPRPQALRDIGIN